MEVNCMPAMARSPSILSDASEHSHASPSSPSWHLSTIFSPGAELLPIVTSISSRKRNLPPENGPLDCIHQRRGASLRGAVRWGRPRRWGGVSRDRERGGELPSHLSPPVTHAGRVPASLAAPTGRQRLAALADHAARLGVGRGQYLSGLRPPSGLSVCAGPARHHVVISCPTAPGRPAWNVRYVATLRAPSAALRCGRPAPLHPAPTSAEQIRALCPVPSRSVLIRAAPTDPVPYRSIPFRLRPRSCRRPVPSRPVPCRSVPPRSAPFPFRPAPSRSVLINHNPFRATNPSLFTSLRPVPCSSEVFDFLFFRRGSVLPNCLLSSRRDSRDINPALIDRIRSETEPTELGLSLHR